MKSDLEALEACLAYWEHSVEQTNKEIAEAVRLPLQMRDWYEGRAEVCRRELKKRKKK